MKKHTAEKAVWIHLSELVVAYHLSQRQKLDTASDALAEFINQYPLTKNAVAFKRCALEANQAFKFIPFEREAIDIQLASLQESLYSQKQMALFSDYALGNTGYVTNVGQRYGDGPHYEESDAWQTGGTLLPQAVSACGEVLSKSQGTTCQLIADHEEPSRLWLALPPFLTNDGPWDKPFCDLRLFQQQKLVKTFKDLKINEPSGAHPHRYIQFTAEQSLQIHAYALAGHTVHLTARPFELKGFLPDFFESSNETVCQFFPADLLNKVIDMLEPVWLPLPEPLTNLLKPQLPWLGEFGAFKS